MAQLNKPIIASWCLYDFGNSCFSSVILTFVFSTYFAKKIAPNALIGTTHWSIALTISGFIIAILAPFTGCWLEQIKQKRTVLISLSLGCIIATFLLFFAKPHPSWMNYALILVVIAEIFYELALILYNSLLVSITPKKWYGRISGWGWGCGYVGGLIVLSLCLFFINSSWISHAESFNIRLSPVICGVWFSLFALPLFILFPKNLPKTVCKYTIKNHLSILKQTLLEIYHLKTIFWFMLARLFYMDGLNTLFAFGGIYAASTFGFSIQSVLLFAILLNITAGIGSFVFAWVDDYLSPLTVILLSLIILISAIATAALIHDATLFWIMGGIIGMFVGPVQASSRSYLAHQVTQEDTYKLFGFYSFSGRISAFLGPMLFGIATATFHSQRAGVATICGLLVIGLTCILLITPKAAKPKSSIR